MLNFLPPFLKVVLSLLIVALSTVLHCTVVFALAVLKFLMPIHAARVALTRALILVAESWLGVNGFVLWLFTSIKWEVEGLEDLRYEGHYLVLSNHQSWVDIPVLQRTFNKRLPFLKFFLKGELIWFPFLGLAWWALDFPFMKRHSKEHLKKHPEMKGSDLETTRKACERFRDVTVSVMNFVEGTRFTESKHSEQQSPFTNLLKPKAGGAGFVLGAMGDILKTVIDVTIVYPGPRPDFFDILSGRLREIRIHVRQLAIPEDLLGGNYENDPEYRTRVQAWITALWVEKDAMMSRMTAGEPATIERTRQPSDGVAA